MENQHIPSEKAIATAKELLNDIAAEYNIEPLFWSFLESWDSKSIGDLKMNIDELKEELHKEMYELISEISI